MRSKVKFIPILAMLALLAALFILLPVSAADEVVEIRDAAGDDKINWIGVEQEVTLHIEDTDLNESADVVGETTDALGDLYAVPAGLGANQNFDVQVQNAPLEGDINDISTNIALSSLLPFAIVDRDAGVVKFRTLIGGLGDTNFEVSYEGATTDTTGNLVHVSSGGDSVGIDVVLTETSPTSGEFVVTLLLTAGVSDAAVPSLHVNDVANDTVELAYDDEDLGNIEDLVTVESRAPSFSSSSPAHDYATTDREPTFSVSMTDGDSGIAQDDDDQIDADWIFRLTDLDGALLAGLANNPYTYDANLGEVSSIPSGWTIEDELPGVTIGFPADGTYLVEWWMKATDLAGNVNVTDEDGDDCDTAAFNIDDGGVATGDCDPYIVRVDKDEPSIVKAVTGNFYDDDDEELDTGSDGSTTSIQVVFDAPMSGGTMVLANFSSDDVVITGVNWYDEDNLDDGADGTEQCLRCSAFLVTEAMATNAEPDVDVESSVTDAAGNDMDDDDDVSAEDRLGAVLTVTVTGTATGEIVSDEDITIRVQSGENLLGSPTVKVFKIDDDSNLEGVNLADANDLALVDTEARIWEIELDLDADGAGLYNVNVTGTETGPSHIVTEAGESGPAIDLDDATFFEIDTGIPDPVFSPADDGETTNPDTFISINFADEGDEYNEDSHDNITLTAATLDGEDISFSSEDNVLFLYKAWGLSEGEHEVAITAVDDAGNESDIEATFEVVERDPFELTVYPGWNLLSLPGSPSDSSIDAVFSDNPDVTAVQSYDAVTNSWVAAVRVDGDWSGSLTNITAGRAYWVNTASFKDVEVDIPGIAGGQQVTPPTINVVAGWNLIPILDITGELESGDNVVADDYLSELKWVKAYSYDTITSTFDAVLPDQDEADVLKVGKGYWIFFEKAGTLVP